MCVSYCKRCYKPLLREYYLCQLVEEAEGGGYYVKRKVKLCVDCFGEMFGE